MSRGETNIKWYERWWAGALGAIALMLLTIILTPLLSPLFEGPSTTKQLSELGRQSSEYSDQRTLKVRMRGDGTTSWVVIDNDKRFWTDERSPESDQITIYDARRPGPSSRLAPAFSFRPAQSQGVMPWKFAVSRVEDLDGDGNSELIGTFINRTNAHPATIPVVIRWVPRTSEYSIQSLIAVRPRLTLARWSSSARVWQDIDRHRTQIIDDRSGVRIAGYGARAFDVIASKSPVSPPVAVAAYYVGGGRSPSSGRWQLAAFTVDLPEGGNAARQCFGPVRIRSAQLKTSELAERGVTRAVELGPEDC